MNRIYTTLAAAVLCFASTASYSGDSHQAIADTFDGLYGDRSGVGLIVQTTPDGVTGVTIMGDNVDTTAALCVAFDDADYVTVRDTSGVYRMESCD